MKRDPFLAVVVFLNAMGAAGSHGAEITWSSHDVALDPSDNTLWSNAANWVGGVVPTAGDSVRITVPVANGSRVTVNDLPGGTQINGIVVTHNQNAISGNSINLGGNVSYTAGGTSIGTITAPLVMLQDTTFSVSANTSNGRLEIGSVISGAFDLIKADAGRLRFATTAKTYTGDTIVTGGLLDMSTDNMLPYGAGRGDVSIAAGAQLYLNNATTNINGLNDYAGGGGAVNKGGSNTRSLVLGNGDADGSFSGSFTFTGGSSTVNKVGAGTQTLSGSVSVVGNGTVSGGRLNINGTWNTGVIVNAAGTVGGTGSIAGSVTGAGTVSPGMSIGSLTVGSATLTTLLIELDGTDVGLSDVLNVTGALDILNATVDFDELVAVDDPAYVFARYGSLNGAAFSSVLDLPAGYQIDYAYNDGLTSTNIALVPIPEPAALVLGALGAGLLACVRRRRG